MSDPLIPFIDEIQAHLNEVARNHYLGQGAALEPVTKIAKVAAAMVVRLGGRHLAETVLQGAQVDATAPVIALLKGGRARVDLDRPPVWCYETDRPRWRTVVIYDPDASPRWTTEIGFTRRESSGDEQDEAIALLMRRGDP